jgi:uncharacterized protein (TIGR02246 family)
MTDDERAIREVVATWMAATKAGDLATVLSLMTDDVVFMVPGQEPFGKEAFTALSHGMNSIDIDAASEVQELQVLGGWAYMRNHIRITATPGNGSEPIRRSGYTLSIFRKAQMAGGGSRGMLISLRPTPLLARALA